MERREYQDLLHLSEADRAALAERIRVQSRNSKQSKGERRRDKRWDFFQSEIAVFVEHPGGGVSRYLVLSRDLSAGGMAFLHGGFLHVGSRCRIALVSLDGQRQVVAGAVMNCQLIEGKSHTISVKFDQRIDPSRFLRECPAADSAAEAKTSTQPTPGEPVYSTLKGREMAKVVDDYVATSRASAKRLFDAIGANDLAALREICMSIKGSAGKCGFEGMGALAAEVIAMLEAAKSIKDVNGQVQSLCRLCERVAPRPDSKNH